MTKLNHVVAIDGPSGSGKSTIAQILAKKLGLTYQDTGAMFRAIGVVLSSLKINFDVLELSKADEEIVAQTLNDLKFEYFVTNSGVKIVINGTDITDRLREHKVSSLASKISRHKIIRDYLAKFQRQVAKDHPSILDGRDIGTVIFPRAFLKIYLLADASIRAKRRYQQLVSERPAEAELYDLKTIYADIVARDKQDMERSIAPLKQAADAFLVDSGNLTVDEVAQHVEKLYKERLVLLEGEQT